MERDKALNSTDALFSRVFRSTIRTFTIVYAMRIAVNAFLAGVPL